MKKLEKLQLETNLTILSKKDALQVKGGGGDPPPWRKKK